MTVRRRVVVHGRVQGVGFRMACAREAARCQIGGWVRNSAGRTVEAAFEGDSEAVDQMVSWCRTGPAAARVTDVEVFDELPAGENRFDIR